MFIGSADVVAAALQAGSEMIGRKILLQLGQGW
jgi:hypothetical protein